MTHLAAFQTIQFPAVSQIIFYNEAKFSPLQKIPPLRYIRKKPTFSSPHKKSRSSYHFQSKTVNAAAFFYLYEECSRRCGCYSISVEYFTTFPNSLLFPNVICKATFEPASSLFDNSLQVRPFPTCRMPVDSLQTVLPDDVPFLPRAFPFLQRTPQSSAGSWPLTIPAPISVPWHFADDLT